MPTSEPTLTPTANDYREAAHYWQVKWAASQGEVERLTAQAALLAKDLETTKHEYYKLHGYWSKLVRGILREVTGA